MCLLAQRQPAFQAGGQQRQQRKVVGDAQLAEMLFDDGEQIAFGQVHLEQRQQARVGIALRPHRHGQGHESFGERRVIIEHALAVGLSQQRTSGLGGDEDR